MFNYWAGVLVVQSATGGLAYAVYRMGLDNTHFLLIILLLEVLFSALMAVWFLDIGKKQHLSAMEKIKDAHAKEREKIKINAERQKTRIVNKSHKQVLKEIRRANTTANVKIGAAFAVALTFGGIMLSTQFVTFGLLILTTAGGSLLGYVARGKQSALADQKKLSVSKGSKQSRPKQIKDNKSSMLTKLLQYKKKK